MAELGLTVKIEESCEQSAITSNVNEVLPVWIVAVLIVAIIVIV